MTNKRILLGESKKAKVNLLDGTMELEFPVITVKSMEGLLDGKLSEKEKYLETKKLVLRVLERNFSDATMADVENMPISNMEAILNTLFKLNGWDIENKNPLGE